MSFLNLFSRQGSSWARTASCHLRAAGSSRRPASRLLLCRTGLPACAAARSVWDVAGGFGLGSVLQALAALFRVCSLRPHQGASQQPSARVETRGPRLQLPPVWNSPPMLQLFGSLFLVPLSRKGSSQWHCHTAPQLGPPSGKMKTKGLAPPLGQIQWEDGGGEPPANTPTPKGRSSSFASSPVTCQRLSSEHDRMAPDPKAQLRGETREHQRERERPGQRRAGLACQLGRGSSCGHVTPNTSLRQGCSGPRGTKTK